MKVATRYRNELLALCLVLMPLAVLTAVTWRLNGQERALAAVRQDEQRALLTAQLAQRMLGALESRRGLDALGTPPSSDGGDFILLSVPLAPGGMSLPWEPRDPTPPVDRAVEALLLEGERLEFLERRPELAAERYASARSAARIPAWRLDATLRQARALGTAGLTDASHASWRRVAMADPGVVDEEGLPLALYGAEALIAGARPEIDAALDAVEAIAVTFGIVPAGPTAPIPSGDRRAEAARSRFELAPPALRAMQELCRRLADAIEEPPHDSARHARRARLDRITEGLHREIEIVERLRSLRRDLPALLSMATPTQRGSASSSEESGPAASGTPPAPTPRSSWLPYGPDPWLVAVTDAGGEGRVLVADGRRLLASLADTGAPGLTDAVAAARLTTAPGPDANLLGPSFPGLFASFPSRVLPSSGSSDLGRVLTFVVLPLVLGITAVATFLLLRDVRREVATAGLRAQFVASVSHELKTPLTSIRMFAETLLLGRQRTGAESVEYLDTIVHESERLSRLIDNVLDFSRIERDERTYRLADTPLDVVIRDAAQAMSYPLGQGGHDLRVSIAEPPPVARADRDALTQAVLNLLSNAVKFSPPGGAIDLELDRVGRDAVIRVRDHGRGIDARDHGAIFQRFYRTPDALAEGTPGTGLGLALVDHVVRAHGGGVAVDSEPGGGSTFTMSLPVSSADPAEGLDP